MVFWEDWSSLWEPTKKGAVWYITLNNVFEPLQYISRKHLNYLQWAETFKMSILYSFYYKTDF